MNTINPLISAMGLMKHRHDDDVPNYDGFYRACKGFKQQALTCKRRIKQGEKSSSLHCQEMQRCLSYL